MSAFKNCIYKISLLAISCIFFASNSYADHLKGGWIKYEYVGTTATSITYTVTFYQYSDCSEPDKVDNAISLAVYDAATNQEIGNPYTIDKSSQVNETKSDFGPCFQNPPTVCYIIASYTQTIELPKNSGGYVLTVQRCCRIAGIENVPVSNTYGLTYTVTIPGGNFSNDNSPVFDFNETVAICAGNIFSIDLSAKDIDGDSLSYSMCTGLTGGSQSIPFVVNPPAPPYRTVSYIFPYSGSQPLGSQSSIDIRTGVFAGTAPSQLGTYVVAVCVDEYRKGVYIGHTRKEIHFNVENCSLGGANLKPSYITCDGFNFTFSDETAVAGYSYLWDFGITGITTDTSTQEQPTYKYIDTGDYVIKLRVDNNNGCQDSATSHLKIYPGFITDFAIDGSCLKNPYSFKDLTTTKYGVVDSWIWNFDNVASDSNQNSEYLFADTGLKTITLITTNSKGCIDTASKQVRVSLGPDVSLGFADTLICDIDTLRLQSSSVNNGATFNWSPLYNIDNPTSQTPLVSPDKTTIYNLSVMYKGCTTEDSIKINVVDHVDLSLPGDTTICKTDIIQLVSTSNALNYSWSPSEGLDSVTNKSPFASPQSTTNYSVIASIGKCNTRDAVNINVIPYPEVDAGTAAAICYGKTVQLNAAVKAAYFTWTPSNSLVNANTLSPVAGPQSTTSYLLTVTDTLGCPKSVTDTVVVNVIPKVIVHVPADTIAVIYQPIQLNATGGENYQWTPATYLNNAFIENPVAIFPGGLDTITYQVRAVTEAGCAGIDSIKIYVFETKPMVFVPTAFTPNNDGLNDIMKPTVAGMQKFLYFNVYNRWGQLLYSTSKEDQGWNGLYTGKPQPSGTYVYNVSAIDYTGKPYSQKGTFVLIR